MVLAVVRRAAGGVVWLAGGGTVGHLAPGFALKDALEARGLAVRFATPGEERERGWFPEGSEPPLTIPTPRRPRGASDAPAFAARLAAAVHRAVRLVRRERPLAVVALGGWPCVPAALAAAAMRTPLFFVASDQVPGVVVRRLAPLARRVYVAHEGAHRALGVPDRTSLVGPILRPWVARARRAPEHFGLSRDLLTLFVTGGSLGARGLNERVAAGLAAAVRAEPAWRERFQVLHSTGRGGVEVAATYREAGIRHRVVEFVHEMDVAWGSADLAVSRAGAMTCAEIEATAVPAVLVPYPHHADRQQHENARPLVERGAAVVVEETDLTPERVRDDVLALLFDEGRRARMRAAAVAARTAGDGSAGPEGGAGRVAEDLVRCLRRSVAGWCRTEGL